MTEPRIIPGPLAPTVTFTTWPGAYRSQGGKRETLTWSELAGRYERDGATVRAKDRLRAPVFATVRDECTPDTCDHAGRPPAPGKPNRPQVLRSHRCDRAVTQNTALVFEHDHKPGETPIAIEVPIAALQSVGLAGIVYETPSCAPDAPRWRVIVPIAQPWVTDAADANEAWKAIVYKPLQSLFAGLFGCALDAADCNRSRVFYPPTRPTTDTPPRRVVWVDGGALDIVATVATIPTPAPAPESPRLAPSSARTDLLIERAIALLKSCEAAIQGAHGSTLTTVTAAKLTRGFELDDATALQLLETHYNPRCVPPWSHDELVRRVTESRKFKKIPIGSLRDAPHPLLVKLADQARKDLNSLFDAACKMRRQVLAGVFAEDAVRVVLEDVVMTYADAALARRKIRKAFEVVDRAAAVAEPVAANDQHTGARVVSIDDARAKRTAYRAAEHNPAPWESLLTRADNGLIHNNVNNAIAILENDPRWAGVLAFDEFGCCAVLRQESPAHAGRPDSYPRPVANTDDALIAAWIQREFPCVGAGMTPDTTAQALQVAARRNQYHPIRDYLDALRWDGVPRVNNWLADYCGAESTDYTRAVGPKWLLSAVARIYQPGCKADHVVIFEGPQGSLKSTTIRTLAGDEYFTDEVPELKSKDAAIQLQGKWIVEFAELDALSRADVASVKAFISRTADVFRPPYGRRSERFPRQCVFAGSTNAGAYLRDETGARRFWPVKLGRIHLDKLVDDRDQLWAEAVFQYRHGGKWWLDEELAKVAADEQDARFERDEWEQQISERLAVAKDGVSVAELLTDTLHKKIGDWTQRDMNRVARILRHLGWERRQTRNGATREWRYYSMTGAV